MKHHLDGLAYWTLKNDREHWDFEWNRRNQFLQLAAVAEAQKPPDGNAWEGGGNVSPSMATVVIVLVLGFFITGCIYIYIQHCVTSSSSTATATATSAAGARAMNSNGTRGLDQSVIDTFPVFQYSAVKELQAGKGALECAVCLSEFQDDETLRLLPKCDHVFHSGCIDAWLVAHSTCPVCRDNLVAVKQLTESPPEEEEVRINIPGDAVTLQNKTFPRSHSTGHSLIQAGDNCERYTLRLPAEVRRQLFARTKLKRATSVIALPRQTSSRRGYRGGGGGGEGSGSNRYGRFFGRSFLSRSTAKVGVGGDLTADSQICNTCSTTVATPLDLSFPHQLPV